VTKEEKKGVMTTPRVEKKKGNNRNEPEGAPAREEKKEHPSYTEGNHRAKKKGGQ